MVQRPGNHGIKIPRDPRLLVRLYWVEEKTLTEIGKMFNVTFTSVRRVFSDFGIPKRQKSARRRRKCLECDLQVKNIKHAIHGYTYGTRCEMHHRKHYTKLAFIYTQRKEIKAKKLQQNYRSYYCGPLNPKDETQWLTKSKILLRNTKRLCGQPKTLRASLSPNEVSRLVRTSLRSCPQSWEI